MVGAGFRDAVRQRARRWTASSARREPSAAVTGLGRRRASYGSGGETSRCGRQPPAPSSCQVHRQEERAPLADQARAGRGDAAGRTFDGAAGARGRTPFVPAITWIGRRGTNQELRSEAPSASEVEERAGWTGRAGVEHALSPALSGARRGHARASAEEGATPPTRDWRDSAGRPTVEVQTQPTESSRWRPRPKLTSWPSKCCLCRSQRSWKQAALARCPTSAFRQRREPAPKPERKSTTSTIICGGSYRWCGLILLRDASACSRGGTAPGWPVRRTVEQKALDCDLIGANWLVLRQVRRAADVSPDDLPHPRLLLGRERGGDGCVKLAAALVDGGRHGQAPAGKRPTSSALGRARKAERVERLGGARS